MDAFVDGLNGWLPAISFFLPLVIGLVVKSALPSGAKSVVMIVLTGVASLLATVEGNGDVLTTEMLTTWVGTLVVTVASYYGVWKPIGAGNPAPEVGIGPKEA